MIESKLEKIKGEIVKTINKYANEYNISYYLLQYIIKDILEEIEIGKNKELPIIMEKAKNIDDLQKSNIDDKIEMGESESDD